MAKLKVCLVCQKYQLAREYLSIHNALEQQFELVRHFVDEKWPSSIQDIPNYSSYEAVIWYVRFRDIITKPPFDWKNYDGVRLMFEQDACQNYSLVAGDQFFGAWPKVFRDHRFDVIACTGKATQDNLRDSGVNAIWIPKGFDHTRFCDLKMMRSGIGYFGELYRARGQMLIHVKRHKIPVTKFKCTFFELNEYLNRFEIILICNMVGTLKKGASKLINRMLPSYGMEISAGPEPMQKNFEVAASGCVQFCDEIPELHDLGFIDGETMVSYRTFDELVQKLEVYRQAPDRLEYIAKQATELSNAKHTWNHRARLFDEAIRNPQSWQNSGRKM